MVPESRTLLEHNDEQIEVTAKKHMLTFDDWPESPHCANGRILPRRLGRLMIYAHIISKRGWPEQTSSTQFNLSMTGEPDITFTEFNG
jgi:hypothetical protein